MKLAWLMPLFTVLINSNALGETTANSESTTATVARKATPVSAIAYFEPIRPWENRDPAFLKPLALTSVSSSVSELKAKLQEMPWKMVYHCDGAPVPAELLAAHGYMDGWINDRAQYTFSIDTYQRRALSAGSKPLVTDPPKVVNGVFKLTAAGRGIFQLQAR